MFMDDMHSDLLFYNVFGLAIIMPDRITVSVNAYKRGRLASRSLEHELKEQAASLEGVDRPILVPFAAWVAEDAISLVPGRMTDKDAEVYVFNKGVIEPIIEAVIRTVRGALLSK